MEVLQALDDLSSVKTGSGLAEARVVLIHQVDVVPSKKTEQVSFGFVIHTLANMILHGLRSFYTLESCC